MSERARFIEFAIKESNELIVEKGLNRLQLSQLNKRVGSSRSRVYSYFGNRLGLLSMVFEDALEKMKAAILKELPKDLGFGGAVHFHIENKDGLFPKKSGVNEFYHLFEEYKEVKEVPPENRAL